MSPILQTSNAKNAKSNKYFYVVNKFQVHLNKTFVDMNIIYRKYKKLSFKK